MNNDFPRMGKEAVEAYFKILCRMDGLVKISASLIQGTIYNKPTRCNSDSIVFIKNYNLQKNTHLKHIL